MTKDEMTTPAVALGTWAWGDSGEAGDGYFGSRLTQEGLETVADAAHAAGLTLWDSAQVYGMGRSEQVLGRVPSRFDRGDYQLSTKFTPQIAGDGQRPVADMLEQSLKNLGTNHIDLYWIHNPADVERWTPQLIPLLRTGKVKHVGVSNHDQAEIDLADRILGEAGYRVEAVQNHYSLLFRSSEQAGVLEHCRRNGIRFYSYMVLEQGALTGRYDREHPMPAGTSRAAVYNSLLPQLEELTDRLARIGQAQGATAADVATAWAIAKGTTPIIGVTRPEYIDGLVRARDIRLSDDEIAELEALADAAQVDTRGSWEHEM